MLQALLATWRDRSANRNLHRLARHRRLLRPLAERLEDRTAPAGFIFQQGGLLTGPQAGEPLDIVLNYLHSQSGALGLSASDVSSLVVTSQYTDAHNGLTHIYFQQFLDGIEIFQGRANASVLSDGSILSIGERLVFNADLASPPHRPIMDAESAVFYAAASVGLDAPDDLTVVSYVGGAAQRAVFAQEDISQDDIPVNLVYDADESGTLRLSWQVTIVMPDGSDWFVFNVDAREGTILNRYSYGDDAGYRVFDYPLESPTAGGRTLVMDPADPTFSPFGWHDTNGVAGAEFTDTRGNNVFAQEDRDNNNSGGFRPDGGAGLNFDFALDLTQDPVNYQSAAIANLFYHNNLLHDVHAHYGFTEAAGNFQEMNYSGAGLGSDSVNADAQDGSGTNNANFFTPVDGQNPRMQMFEWTFTTPRRDSDLDTQVIIHEYGHGVSNRLTGGPADATALDGLQSGGMGEGWSDWWALAFLAEPGDAPTDRHGVGTYLFGQPLTGVGIRKFPYSTDVFTQPLTFGNLNTELQVHALGEIWSTTLWDMFWLFVDRYGFDSDLKSGNGGNNQAIQLVMDGLKIQPRRPRFTDARDAILQADVVNFGGANQDIIWQAFAGRGLGFSASAGPNDNSSNIREAFDLPPAFIGSISGQKFNDLNSNNAKDGGEPGIQNWQIYLDTNNNAVFDAASTVTRTSTDVPKTINNFAISVSNLTLSGFTSRILDINVNLTINHTADRDLGLALVSPSGKRVNLAAGIGGTANNFTNTIFDDQAATSIYNGAAPFTGTFRPTGQLSSLNHEDANGLWRLEVCDAMGSNTGSVAAWSMIITIGDASVLTNASGNYTFANLKPGTYAVHEVQQAGWAQTFPLSGFHTITLGVGQNQANVDFGNTQGNNPPINVSAGGPYTVSEGGLLNLNGSGTDPENVPLTFTWDINGDGMFGDAVGQNPSLSWAALEALVPPINDGPRVINTLRVRASDGVNTVDSAATSLTVNNTAPTATLSNNGPVVEGATAQVSFSGQFDPSVPDTAAGFRYSYDFNDDGFFEVGNGTTYAGSVANASETVSALYLQDGPGVRRVRARIFDKDNGFTQVTTDIVITNVDPTAALINTGPIQEGQSASVVFINQFDPSTPDTTAGFRYSYDFDNDGVYEVGNGATYAGSVTASSQVVPPQFLDDGAGPRRVRARIFDKDNGFQELTTDIVIGNVPPVATFGNNGPAGEGSATTSVSFTNPFDPSDADTAAGFRYSYDFDNDGVFEVGNGLSYAGSVSNAVQLVPAAFLNDGPGVRRVRARIFDKNDGSTEYTTDIVLTNVDPTGTLANNGPVSEGSTTATVTFTGPFDPSPSDTAAGFRYNYDFNDDGVYEVGDGFSYAGSVANATQLVPSALLDDGPGTRRVRARIFDKDGGFAQRTTDIVINNVTPTATLTNNGPIDEGSAFATVSFLNPSDPSTADTSAGFRYSYDFNNDGLYEVGDGSSYAGSVANATQDVTGTFLNDGPGVQRVRARIFDKDGGLSELTTDIIIVNRDPSAVLTNSGPAPEGSTTTSVTFTNQTDPSPADESAGFRYSYDFNDDGLFEIGNGTYAGSVTNATQLVPSAFLPDGFGTARVRARIIDMDGGFTDLTTDILLNNVAPIVTAPGSNPQGTEGSSTLFNLGSFTDPGADSPWAVTVNWGDGQVDNFNVASTGTLPSLAHTYEDNGTFNVQVTVNDGDFGVASAFFDISVVNVTPIYTPPAGQVAPERTLTNFQVGSFIDAGVNDDPWFVRVNWNDGTPVTTFNALAQGVLPDVAHRFPRDGIFQVKVTVRDKDGAQTAAFFQVVVQNIDVTMIGTDAGASPSVRVFDSATNALKFVFSPFSDFPGFLGGARVASSDLNGDGAVDFIIGSGPGMLTLVRVFDGRTLQRIDSFSPFGPTFIGATQGAYVATGDVTGDGRAEIIVGAGGFSQQVRVFTYVNSFNSANRVQFDAFNALPGNPSIDGVTVASGDVDGDGRDDIVVGAGPGGPAHVRVYKYNIPGNALSRAQIGAFTAFEANYRRGIFVAAGDTNNNGRAEIVVGAGTTSGRVTQDGPNGGRGLAPRARLYSGIGNSWFFTQFQPFPASFDTGVRVAVVPNGGFAKILTSSGHSVPGLALRFDGQSLALIDTLFSDPAFTRGLFVGASR